MTPLARARRVAVKGGAVGLLLPALLLALWEALSRFGLADKLPAIHLGFCQYPRRAHRRLRL